LFYLLQQLKSNGITSVVLMTGYLGDQIKDYFGDGSKFGFELKYSHGPAEWDTGKRLWEARDLLEEIFLLLYSDNFASFKLIRSLQGNHCVDCLLHLMVTKKESGNIEINEAGMVKTYDKTRSSDNLAFVELGYMVANKKIFSYYKNPEISFSHIIEWLVKDQKVTYYINHEGYQSISDPARLERTRKYFQPKKIILIDRDGVINKKAPRGEYVSSWDEFDFIPETLEGMRSLSKKGYEFIIISNQAGIGRGVLARECVDNVNEKMSIELKKTALKY